MDLSTACFSFSNYLQQTFTLLGPTNRKLGTRFNQIIRHKGLQLLKSFTTFNLHLAFISEANRS